MWTNNRQSKEWPTMARQCKAWMITPKKASKPTVPDSIKVELEAKAAKLIEAVLKPKHIQPPPAREQFNYVTDIGAKWHSNSFYFISTYTCPGPNAISPTFESKFAPMEYLGDGRFAPCFMRHTGEWVGIYDALSVDQSMKAIQDDEWFVP
jgi:hypothetical protein